jgi:hypothetical protein
MARLAGYEDQQKQKEEKQRENKPKSKPKPKPAAPHGNGISAAPRPAAVAGIPQQAAGVAAPAPALVMGPSPYEDRKRVLQERLRRIETQLRKLDRMNKAAPEGPFGAGPQHAAHGMEQHVASAIPPHMQAISYESPAAAGTKRRASEGGGGSAVKKVKSSGGGGGGCSNKLGAKAEVIMSSLMENPASKAYFNKPVDPINDGAGP